MTADERGVRRAVGGAAFALVVSSTSSACSSWSEWTEAVAAAPEAGYYERWLATLERLLLARGETDEMTLARYRHAWRHAAARTPHGTPIELAPGDFG